MRTTRLGKTGMIVSRIGFGGIPIVYMGDELCQPDDTTWQDDPARQADSRWAHRPMFDDELAARRHDPTTPTGRLWTGLRHLVETRRSCPGLDDTAAVVRPFHTGVDWVFGWHRSSGRYGDLVGLANVGDGTVTITEHPSVPAEAVDLLAPDGLSPWTVAPLQVRWIGAPGPLAPQPRPPH